MPHWPACMCTISRMAANTGHEELCWKVKHGGHCPSATLGRCPFATLGRWLYALALTKDRQSPWQYATTWSRPTPHPLLMQGIFSAAVGLVNAGSQEQSLYLCVAVSKGVRATKFRGACQGRWPAAYAGHSPLRRQHCVPGLQSSPVTPVAHSFLCASSLEQSTAALQRNGQPSRPSPGGTTCCGCPDDSHSRH